MGGGERGGMTFVLDWKPKVIYCFVDDVAWMMCGGKGGMTFVVDCKQKVIFFCG